MVYSRTTGLNLPCPRRSLRWDINDDNRYLLKKALTYVLDTELFVLHTPYC